MILQKYVVGFLNMDVDAPDRFTTDASLYLSGRDYDPEYISDDEEEDGEEEDGEEEDGEEEDGEEEDGEEDDGEEDDGEEDDGEEEDKTKS
jgi:hypothetical protein